MPTDTTRVFLVGLYGVENLGDRAIRETIERLAPGLGAEIVRFSSRVELSDPRAVVLRSRRWWRWLRAFTEVDRVVIGGGGLLKDESIRFSLELLLAAVLGRVLRRDVTLLSVGVAPFYTRLGRAVIAMTARRASVRTVRDAESAVALRGLGVDDVEVRADPMFCTVDQRPNGAVRRQRRVLLAIRPWFHKDPDGGAARWPPLLASVTRLVEELMERGWDVHLSCLYWPEDREVADAIAAGVSSRERLTIDDAPRGWDETVALAATFELVIAMRYHAVAAASVAGRPVIALPYEPKVRSLATEVDVPMVEVDDPRLTERILELVDADGARVPDRGTIASLRERAMRAVQEALVPA
ncbi:MAG TPA: polysaccharide pyruvyl transferase family protein [Solirubrobacteraceae bacterium]